MPCLEVLPENVAARASCTARHQPVTSRESAAAQAVLSDRYRLVAIARGTVLTSDESSRAGLSQRCLCAGIRWRSNALISACDRMRLASSRMTLPVRLARRLEYAGLVLHL
jgi:hypothetical protein